MRLVGIVAFATAGACYSPTYQDCELACAGTTCPSGLTCDVTGVCRLPGMTAACGTPPMIDAPGTCWPYTASTIDPCAPGFPPSVGPLSVAMMKTIDTNGPSDGVPFLGGRYVVLHVDSVDIGPSAVLAVTGLRPLIIVSDGNVDVTGIINVQPTLAVPMDCAVGSPAMSGSTGAGGPGGGFGTAGGNGGSTIVLSTTTGGVVNGDALLDPLRPGCPGGPGAGPMGGVGGRRGSGGGALQITTKTQIIVSGGGTIAAGGSGGGGGAYTTCAGATCTGGGGGGGTGGAILLEGNRVEVRAQGRVCAVGGGGGNAPQTSMPPTSGASGADANLCTGGMPGMIGNRGGRGADVAGAPGAAGVSGTNNLDSGAGGGGGLGRIRIRGIVQREVLGTAIPVPAP